MLWGNFFFLELKVARSILLQGANGTGKTTLVRLVAKHLGANLLPLDGLHPLTAHSHTIFQAALRLQPAIIFLDDIELIFPASGGASIYRQLRELSLYLQHLGTSGRHLKNLLPFATNWFFLSRTYWKLSCGTCWNGFQHQCFAYQSKETVWRGNIATGTHYYLQLVF